MNSPAPKTTTMTNHNLAAQLKQIGLCALPTQLDDFIARVTKARCSAHQILEELAKAEASERSRRSLERRELLVRATNERSHSRPSVQFEIAILSWSVVVIPFIWICSGTASPAGAFAGRPAVQSFGAQSVCVV